MAVKTVFGAGAGGIARGVALRRDHGSPFMADHLQNQIKFWGMAPSFAFLAEPESNGVAKRLAGNSETKHHDLAGSKSAQYPRSAPRATKPNATAARLNFKGPHTDRVAQAASVAVSAVNDISQE
jgi:hypothetical protein